MLLNLRYQLDVCVGANTVRPSKKQAHGNNKVRQQKILPDNSEFTANPEHGRTVFARRSNKPTVTTRFGSKKFSPTILNLQQILSTGERCSPLQIIRESLSCRKIATLGAGGTTLFSFANSSLLTPHSSFLTPHLIPLPSCILPHFRL